MDTKEENTTKQTEQVLEEGVDVRERVRTIVLEAFQRQKEGLAGLGQVIEEVLGVAAEQVSRIPEEQQGGQFEEVVRGVSDAASSSATATKLALEEARTNGEHIAKEELEELKDDLRGIERRISGIAERFANKTSSDVLQQFERLQEHVSRTFTQMRPSIEQTLRATLDNPSAVAQDALKAGAETTVRGVSTFANAVRGLIDAAVEQTPSKDKKNSE